jgi:hypothetical protein
MFSENRDTHELFEALQKFSGFEKDAHGTQ